MLRTLVICAVISASAMGCASTTQPQRTASAAVPLPAGCAPLESASRIPAKAGSCSSQPGRVYTRTDVDRTGQTNVGDALQMLDPSISVHH
jgi:outer membrane murein-binding lipoprotein Lpp